MRNNRSPNWYLRKWHPISCVGGQPTSSVFIVRVLVEEHSPEVHCACHIPAACRCRSHLYCPLKCTWYPLRQYIHSRSHWVTSGTNMHVSPEAPTKQCIYKNKRTSSLSMRRNSVVRRSRPLPSSNNLGKQCHSTQEGQEVHDLLTPPSDDDPKHTDSSQSAARRHDKRLPCSHNLRDTISDPKIS